MNGRWWRIACRRLTLLAVLLSLSACGIVNSYRESRAAAKEESRQQAIREMGERNRVFHERRRLIMDSPLYQAGLKYVDAVLEERVPGCEKSLSMEPLASFVHTEDEALKETLRKVPESVEEYREFFDRMELSIYVNFWDFDMDAKELCQVLMERGISGSLAADDFSQDCWNFNAGSETIEYYRMPGV